MTEAQPVAEVPADSLITEQPPAIDFTAGKPEGFPDDFWDAEKKAPVVDKLFNAYSQEKKRAEGLRVKLSKGEFEGKAPEDIKEYTLELDEKLKPLVPDDDPIFNAAREAAKQAGLPKEAFSKFMMPVISKLAELKSEAETPPTEEEIAEYKSKELEKLGPGGAKIAAAVKGYVDQMETLGTFSKAEADAVRAMANSADALRVFNKFRVMAGGSNVPVDIPLDEKSARSDIETKMAQAMATGNEGEYNKYSAMLAKLNN